MNERIKELAEQTDIQFYKSYVPETGFKYEGAEVTVEDLKKFAELIVRKCIHQVDKSNYNSGDEWDKAMTCAANNIQEHFGIK